jgi:hypothetical protein
MIESADIKRYEMRRVLEKRRSILRSMMESNIKPITSVMGDTYLSYFLKKTLASSIIYTV